MLALDTHPETRRADVVVDGEVTKADYERVEPELDAFIAEHSPVRLLVEIRSLEDVGLQAIGEDLGLTTRHLNDFDRIAFVSRSDWQRSLMAMIGPIAPADVRGYGPAERAVAEAWLDA